VTGCTVGVQESVRVDAEAVPCWCPCQPGVVSCSLRLDRRAFVPGEDISVVVDIQNASRKQIASSYVAMTQVHTHTSPSIGFNANDDRSPAVFGSAVDEVSYIPGKVCHVSAAVAC